MSFRCPDCKASIASWMVKQAHFECPDCKRPLISNGRRQLKRSLFVAVAVWLVFLLAVQHYIGSWGYAVVVSIEAGGILAVMSAVVFYRFTVRLKSGG